MDLLKVFQTESLEYIQELISMKEIPLQFEWMNYAALNSSLENGRIDVAELLLKSNCTVNSFSILPQEGTPLHNAVKLGYSKLVVTLLSRGAIISSVDGDGNTPLHLAFLYKRKDIVNIILSFIGHTKNYVNMKNTLGLSHFHIACSGNASSNLSVVIGYLNAGVQISDSVSNKSALWAGFTALHFAVEYKCLNVFKFLCSRASQDDCNKKDSKGRTPRDLLKKHLEELLVIDKMLSQGSLSYFELTCLQSDQNSTNLLNSFIKHGVDINLQLGFSNSFCSLYTPLHFAVDSGEPENVKVLLKNNANCQIQNVKQMTPLHKAFYDENSAATTEIVNLLYAATSDKEVNLQDVNGLNYLHIACSRNDLDTVKKILSSSHKDVNCEISYDRNKYSRYTPLHFAVKFKHLQTAKLLLKHGADVNANRNSVHGTPLHLAFLVSQVDMIELLLENGADAKAICSFNGATTLHILVDCCVHSRRDGPVNNQIFLSYLDKLVNLGVDVNAQDLTGFTPLHVACTGFGADCVLRLLSLGADVNLKNKDGKTPFEMIFEHRFEEYARVFYCVIFYEHVQKLKELGLTVRVKNNECCEKVLLKKKELNEETRKMLDDKLLVLKNERADEIVKMKNKKINDQVSLFDFLKFRPKRAADFVDCEVLLEMIKCEGFLKKEYPAFGYFIRLQYQKGASNARVHTRVDDNASNKAE